MRFKQFLPASEKNCFLKKTVRMILRAKKAGNFTTVYNEFIYDDRLTARAKGVLLWVLSQKDDWVIYKSTIHKSFKESRETIWKAFKELVSAGYVIETDVIDRNKNGAIVGRRVDYLVYEVSIFSKNHKVLYHSLEPQNQSLGLRSVTNTNCITNTEKTKKTNTKGEQVRGQNRFYNFLAKSGLEKATEKTLEGLMDGNSVSVSVLPDELLISLLQAGCTRTVNNKLIYNGV